MKKIISAFTILVLLSLLIFVNGSYAANLGTLDSINIEPSKTLIRPDEEVKLNVNFGTPLGAYTVNVLYDTNIFDYVGVEGATGNNTSNKVIATFYDALNPRENMSITFKAKAGITTSNPTEFTFTLDGLAAPNADTYDDIGTPIVKNVVVEPEYVDYLLKLETTESLVKDKEIPMTLSYSSPMGRYYDHIRLVADASTPNDASVRLLAIDENDLEHDIIDSGWGNAQGYSIGGKDVLQVLQTRAIFSENGNYTITLKLIDRDNSDQVVAQKSFDFNLSENVVTTPEEAKKEEKPTKPTKLPKTGENIYVLVSVILTILISTYVLYNKKK